MNYKNPIRMCLIVGFLAIVVIFIMHNAEGADHTVHPTIPSADFTTIQGAIDDAGTNNGDNIYVWAETYVEYVTASKSVSLIGNGSSNTTINPGGDALPTIGVTASNVNISGFNIERGVFQVWVNSENNINIWNNTILTEIANQPNINVDSGDNIYVHNNTMDGSKTGIWFNGGCDNARVDNNTIISDAEGIHFDGDLINAYGNNITYNTSSAFTNLVYGIYVGGSEGGNIFNNTVISYQWGIFITTGDNMTINSNRLYDMTLCGLRINTSAGSYIYHNQFYNNTIHALDDTGDNFWNLGYVADGGGNYWDTWTSPDVKNGPTQAGISPDGVVDNPYIINTTNNIIDRYPLVTPIPDLTIPEETISWSLQVPERPLDDEEPPSVPLPPPSIPPSICFLPIFGVVVAGGGALTITSKNKKKGGI